jgi:hypothetical protein
MGAKQRVLVLAAFGEAATGVALLLVPSLVGQWPTVTTLGCSVCHNGNVC